VTGPLGPTGAAGGTGPFTPMFRDWVIGGEPDPCVTPPYGPTTIDTSSDCTAPSGPTADICHMGSRWNYYGGNGCWFVDYPAGGKQTLTTGGDLLYGRPAPANDPILNQPVVILGNTFGGRGSNARLVDIDPYAPWSSQIIFNSVRVGDDNVYIAGQQYLRMHSRLFFLPRNVSLMIAGVMGVIFQTTFPFEQLEYQVGGSQLLQTLVGAMQKQGAQGLMMRFTAFSTLYYQNGVFNDIPQRPTNADQIEAMYRAGEVFSHPAYSTVVGAFGVWNQGELSTAPGGHLLVPKGKPKPLSAAQSPLTSHVESVMVSGHGEARFTMKYEPNPDAPAGLSDAEAFDAGDPANAQASAAPKLALGPALAELGPTGNYISLDLSNTIPDLSPTGPSGQKYDYGPITVGVQGPTGFTPIGTFGSYDWDSYVSKSGIVDVPFNNITTWQVQQLIQQGGLLAMQVEGPSGPSGQPVTISVEQPFCAETDARGVYLDECNSAQMTVQVRYKNGTPPAGTRLLLAQYYQWQLNTNTGSWQLSGTTGQGPTGYFCYVEPPGQYLNFPGASGPTAVVPVTIPQLNGATAPYGEATVTVEHNLPGFPVVAFYPFTGPAPTPQTAVGFVGDDPNVYIIGTSHFSNVRAMPADNYLLQEFVDCWNGTGSYAGTPRYNRLQTWNFIYQNILYVYDALYPVMDQFMPLGSLESVEAAVDQLVTMISEEWVDQSTLYMPVTRELSAAKRLILLTWGDLINRKYPQEDLPTLNVPCNQ
jgi:hypothetical protein